MNKILDFLKILDTEDKQERIRELHKILDPGPFYHSCYLIGASIPLILHPCHDCSSYT